MQKFLPALDATREAGHSRAKELMDVLRKSSGQFYAELDPERDDRKLGFVDAFTIAEFTRDYSGIVTACAAIGLTVSVNAAVPDKATSREEGADDIRALSEMQAAMAQGDFPVIVTALAGRVCDEIKQTAAKYSEEWEAK